MTSTRLSPLDAAWLFTETRATPNHVGGLLPFKLPPGAPKDFMLQLMADFRNHREFAAPWNRRLKYAFNKNPVPAWIEDDNMDMEYHVRHAALPWPGGERELGELVARLQSQPLDLSRPPWECTLIEGLEDGRFAMFVKMHHSLIDGVSGMKLLQRAMATDREKSLKSPPFWAIGLSTRAAQEPGAERDTSSPTFANAASAAVEALSGQAKSIPQLIMAFGKMVKRVGDTSEGMMVPFDAPASILNGRVREKRRFATQQFSLERMRNLATAANCTLNDIVLAICGGALRRFLQDSDALPDKPLTAGIPVSVRPKDDENTGNAITFIISTLGTDIEDPAERLAAIRASVQHAKEHVQSLPKKAMTQYTVLLMAPTLLTLLTGIGGRTRPMFNITISNVPGPDKPMYFRGAELLATYPASIVTHGQALNITCQSYAGYMNFGFTGCHASVPHMQRVAVYTGEALDELEAVFIRPAKATKAVAVKKPAAKKAAVKKAAVKKTVAPKAAVKKITAPKKVAARKRAS
jgi:diacylglycerol O-acyltransferase / wax synthase